jgi:HD-GYP domain-containing protein (c-di-GMP phosphodiesterase class II)
MLVGPSEFERSATFPDSGNATLDNHGQRAFDIARQRLKAADEAAAKGFYRLDLPHEQILDSWLLFPENWEPGTLGHCKRTGLCAGVFAGLAGWSDDEVAQIRLAAPLHDIGKVLIPQTILGKPAKLSPAETLVMQSHTTWGARLLHGLNSPVLRLAREIALQHHEHWDGRGYPSGLSGQAISQSARMVAIVDVFDALSHDRDYRKALPQSEVIGVLTEQRGNQFDPNLLDIFLAHIPQMQNAIGVT